MNSDSNQTGTNAFKITNNKVCLFFFFIIHVILIENYLDYQEMSFIMRWGGAIILSPLPVINSILGFLGLLSYWQIGWVLSGLLIVSLFLLIFRKNKIIEVVYLVFFIVFFFFCFYKSIPPSPAAVEQEFDQRGNNIGRFRAEQKVDKLFKRYKIAMERATKYQWLSAFFKSNSDADDELSKVYDKLLSEESNSGKIEKDGSGSIKKKTPPQNTGYGAWLRSFSDELGDLNRAALKISIFSMHDEGLEGTAGFVYPDPNDNNSKIFLIASSTNTSRFSTCRIASYLIDNLEESTVILETCPDLTVKTAGKSLIIEGNDCGDCGMGAEITGAYQFVTNYKFHQ